MLCWKGLEYADCIPDRVKTPHLNKGCFWV